MDQEVNSQKQTWLTAILLVLYEKNSELRSTNKKVIGADVDLL